MLFGVSGLVRLDFLNNSYILSSYDYIELREADYD